jgi:hypothetical protein
VGRGRDLRPDLGQWAGDLAGNGTAWTRVTTPSPDPEYDSLEAIAAVPSTHIVWAAGTAGGQTLTMTAGR